MLNHFKWQYIAHCALASEVTEMKAALITRIFIITVCCMLPAATKGPVFAQVDSQIAGDPVTFAMSQAENGEYKYLRYCEECHGADLGGGMNGGALLRGNAFEEKWANGMQASVLYYYLRTAMPPGSPGRYSDKTYTDIMAFILKHNGFAEGDPLPSDLDLLDTLLMVK